VQDEKLFRAKISDFGLSAHMTAGQTSVSISQGTEAYLPKEVFQNLAVTEASDIYALGLLMWEIFYGIFWFIVWDTEKRRKKCDSSTCSALSSEARKSAQEHARAPKSTLPVPLALARSMCMRSWCSLGPYLSIWHLFHWLTWLPPLPVTACIRLAACV
jgi:serine/threonine protein kinase